MCHNVLILVIYTAEALLPTINCQLRIVKLLKDFSLRLSPPYGKVEKGGMETKLMNSWL